MQMLILTALGAHRLDSKQESIPDFATSWLGWRLRSPRGEAVIWTTQGLISYGLGVYRREAELLRNLVPAQHSPAGLR